MRWILIVLFISHCSWNWYSNIYPTRCNVTQFIISGNCSTCFGWYFYPSSVAHTTVSTAFGICHTVTATCRYRGRVGTGLSVHTQTSRYSCMPSWWWVEVTPVTCRAVSRYNKLRNVASCSIYIGLYLRCTDPWTSHSTTFYQHQPWLSFSFLLTLTTAMKVKLQRSRR